MDDERIKEKYNLSQETLDMIRSGLEALEEGRVGKKVDIKSDFPGLLDEEDKK